MADESVDMKAVKTVSLRVELSVVKKAGITAEMKAVS